MEKVNPNCAECEINKMELVKLREAMTGIKRQVLAFDLQTTINKNPTLIALSSAAFIENVRLICQMNDDDDPFDLANRTVDDLTEVITEFMTEKIQLDSNQKDATISSSESQALSAGVDDGEMNASSVDTMSIIDISCNDTNTSAVNIRDVEEKSTDSIRQKDSKVRSKLGKIAQFFGNKAQKIEQKASLPIENSMCGLTANQAMVYRCIQCVKLDEGTHVAQVILNLKDKLSEKEIRDIIEYLSGEGYIFSTVDDDHYRSID